MVAYPGQASMQGWCTDLVVKVDIRYPQHADGDFFHWTGRLAARSMDGSQTPQTLWAGDGQPSDESNLNNTARKFTIPAHAFIWFLSPPDTRRDSGNEAETGVRSANPNLLPGRTCSAPGYNLNLNSISVSLRA